MGLPGKCLAYFYALALSLGSLYMPPAGLASSDAQLQNFSHSTEKVASFHHFDHGYIVSENNRAYSFSYDSSGDGDTFNFFNTRGFQYSFLSNFYAIAYRLSKIHDINFKFIDLFYPFQYFW